MYSFHVIDLLYLLQRVTDAGAHQLGWPSQCTIHRILLYTQLRVALGKMKLNGKDKVAGEYGVARDDGAQ
jgi:hypothetical protein